MDASAVGVFSVDYSINQLIYYIICYSIRVYFELDSELNQFMGDLIPSVISAIQLDGRLEQRISRKWRQMSNRNFDKKTSFVQFASLIQILTFNEWLCPSWFRVKCCQFLGMSTEIPSLSVLLRIQTKFQPILKFNLSILLVLEDIWLIRGIDQPDKTYKSNIINIIQGSSIRPHLLVATTNWVSMVSDHWSEPNHIHYVQRRRSVVNFYKNLSQLVQVKW